MRRKDREVTDMEEIKDIMKKCEVCSLGFQDEEVPYVIPLNFGFEIRENKILLYFHGSKVGKKLELLKKNQRVAFEMHCSTKLILNETACDSTMEYESVCGNGTMTLLNDVEKEKVLTLLMNQYGTEETYSFSERALACVAVMKLEVSEITGKRLMKSGQE